MRTRCEGAGMCSAGAMKKYRSPSGRLLYCEGGVLADMYALGDLAHREPAKLDKAEERLAAQHAVVLLRVARVSVPHGERGQRVEYIQRLDGSRGQLIRKVPPHSNPDGLLCLDALLRDRLGVFGMPWQGDLGQRR
jgi:hypothetical protein